MKCSVLPRLAFGCVFTLFLATGCAVTPVAPGTPAPTPTPGPLETRLRELDLTFSMGDAFGNGKTVPDADTYRFNPSTLLGATYASTLKHSALQNGVTCETASKDDLQLERVQAVGVDASCTPVTSPPIPFQRLILIGGADAAALFPGVELGLEAEGIHELYVDVPLSVTQPPNSCLSDVAIRQLFIPQNTCDFYTVTAAKQVLIKKRTFVKFDLAADVQYTSIIKFDGDFFGSTEKVDPWYFLTADLSLFGTLGMEYNPNGTLKSWGTMAMQPNVPLAIPTSVVPDGQVIVTDTGVVLEPILGSEFESIFPSVSDIFPAIEVPLIEVPLFEVPLFDGPTIDGPMLEP